MSSDFNTIAHGKWILSGEYSVIKGGRAIAFPLKSKQMSLQYYDTHAPLTISAENDTMATFCEKTLRYSMELLGQSALGHFQFENTIPIGAGMGASAALCVNITRWLIWKKLVAAHELFSFARGLEHLFHGNSSGLDIAAVMQDQAIVFQQQQYTVITPAWQPHWYLSYCGTSSTTVQCVQHVTELLAHNHGLAQELDQLMQHSVMRAIQALQDPSPQGQHSLAAAINMACDCFQQWGLANGPMRQHLDDLLQKGAIAVKPTGSGAGGYVLSLWAHDALPSDEVLQDGGFLIPSSPTS